MVNTEGLCKHGKIWRNCYACHLEFTYPNDKTLMDTIHETISELKIRVSKLEEYKRLQDDFNKKTNENHAHIFLRINSLDEHRKKQIDENRAAYKHLCELENLVEKHHERLKTLEELAKISFFVAQESPTWESTVKTKNMTFIQAFKLFNEGKSIMRNAIRYSNAEPNSPTFSPNDVLATDWEIAP